MHIMTANGWMQLSPRDFTPAPEATASNGVPAPYQGKFPSAAICDAHNRMKAEMRYFDDGIRMVYGKPDKTVPTDNAEAANPIPYPPHGF